MFKFPFRVILMLCGLSVVGCQALTSTGGSSSGKAPEPTTQGSIQILGETIPIREARQLIGRKVQVSGTVTAQSGAYASSISSGFAIQDETAGIYVIDDTHSYQLGQKVTITGTVGTEYMQRNIVLEKSTLLNGSGTITPRTVKTGYVGENDVYEIMPRILPDIQRE